MINNRINYLKYRFGYFLFKLLCKKEIEEAWAEAELKERTDFFEKSCPEKKDKFEEAYYKVWLPLYNNYIKRS